jgi:rod shape-determining protein MreC
MKNFFRFSLFFILILCLIFVFIAAHRDIALFINNGKLFIGSLFSKQESIEELKIENENLKQQIASLEILREKKERYHYKIAQVYSYYPFNDAGLVVIDLGSDDGIREGMPVMVKEGILFGKIKSVKRTQSEVETIFSSQWKTSVSIGKESTKAVLNGGPTPVIDLIPIDKDISFDDEVKNNVPELPMAFLGTLSEIKKNTNDVWKKSSLKVPYTIESLHSLLVVVDFP